MPSRNSANSSSHGFFSAARAFGRMRLRTITSSERGGGSSGGTLNTLGASSTPGGGGSTPAFRSDCEPESGTLLQVSRTHARGQGDSPGTRLLAALIAVHGLVETEARM